MSSFIITISRTIFFRLLAHAPEDLQRKAKENARGAIPALCFTEDDIRKKFAQEEQWDGLTEDVQREAVRLLMDADVHDYEGLAAQAELSRKLNYDLAMLPEKIDKAEADLRAHAAAIEARNRNLPGGAEAGRRGFAIELRRGAASDETIAFTERELAGNQIRQLVVAVEREALKYGSATLLLGAYTGFEIYSSAACLNVAKDLSQGLFGQASLYLRLKDHRVEYGFNLTDSDAGIIQSMDARLRGIDKRFAEAEETRRRLIDHRARIEAELAKGWEYTTKFQELRARLDALNTSMRVEGLITEEPLHLADLAEEAFLPTTPESNGVPAVARGIEQAAASAGSAADDQSLQIEPAIPATSECAVLVPASPEKTADHQSQEPRIEAIVPTVTGNGVEEYPAIEVGAARATIDWDELFARRERIKAEREKRPRPKRRAASRSSAQLSFDWG